MSNINLAFLTSTNKFYESLIADIDSSRESVRIQMYWIATGSVAEKLSVSLIKAVGRGVTVEFVYDSVGSFYTPKSYFERLRRGGVTVVEYHPVNLNRSIKPFSIKRLFRRNHRKMILIDRLIYYVGGMNIGDGFGDWTDVMVRGEGEPVAGLERSFDHVMGWGGKPQLTKYGASIGKAIQVCDCIPKREYFPLKRLYLAAIKKARKRIWLAQAYFIPRRKLKKALIKAAIRGVDVRVIVPEESDVWMADMASWPVIGKLVKKGVKVHRFQKSMLHTKMAIIDDDWATLGTANLDSMSMYWNSEINLVFRDGNVSESLSQIFLGYVKESRQVRANEFSEMIFWSRGIGRLLYYYSWLL